jgi:plastocyanin
MHVHRVRGCGSQPDSGPTCLPLGPARQWERGRLLVAFAAAALVVTAAGCGGGGEGSSTGAASASSASTSTASSTTASSSGKATRLHIEAEPSGALRFNKTALSAPAGKVTIVMANPSPLRHDVAIEGNGVKITGNIVSTGGTSTVTANLKPGTYTFLCTVDSHADAGMKGTLTVS